MQVADIAAAHHDGTAGTSDALQHQSRPRNVGLHFFHRHFSPSTSSQGNRDALTSFAISGRCVKLLRRAVERTKILVKRAAEWVPSDIRQEMAALTQVTNLSHSLVTTRRREDVDAVDDVYADYELRMNVFELLSENECFREK